LRCRLLPDFDAVFKVFFPEWIALLDALHSSHFRLDALALNVIATATWLGGCFAVCHSRYCIKTTQNLSENFLDHLVGPSFKHLGPLTPIPNSTGNPFIGGIKYTGGGKIADFRSIFEVHRRLSRKRCEIGRWLLWNVNRKSWVPDSMV